MADRLDAAALRSLLSYDAETGEFRWNVSRRRVQAGDSAGSPSNKGYVQIKVSGVLYKAHRLAWLHHYGAWPRGVIDHINRDKADNRIANLRDTTKTVNGLNRDALANNVTGASGVHYEPRYGGRWYAKITEGGRRKYLGSFDTKEDAASAYATARLAIITKETANAG